MSKIRHLPFGYCIKNGAYTFQEEEAALVKKIFERYLQGATMRAIAEELNTQPIRYQADKEAWDQNMILRMLKKTKYCDGKEFPMLITPEIFEKATALRQSKSYSINPDLTVIRKVVTCPKCGARLYRNSKIPQRVLWQCRECDTSCGPTPDADFIDEVVAALNAAITHAEDIQPPNDPDNRLSLQVSRLTNEINRELERPQAEPERLLPLILECAAEKYAVCSVGDHDPATMQVQAALTGHPPLTAFDGPLFQSVVKQVVMQPTGSIRLRLQNGQILENRKECDGHDA